MAHQVQDFEIHAGDDLVIEGKVTVDGKPTGAPINLAGAEMIFGLASRDAAAERALTKTTDVDDGIEITDAGAGEFEITLQDEDTADLEGRYQYQVRVTDSAGDKATVLQGMVTVQRTIFGADE